VTYLSASKKADSAQHKAQMAMYQSKGDDPGVRFLADSVADLAAAVSELAQAMHRDSN